MWLGKFSALRKMPPPAEEQGPAPPGWRRWYSERRKKYYYHNDRTGEVQWTTPSAVRVTPLAYFVSVFTS
jgi:hypothetical protein